jgi:hypothetical protein
MQMTKMTESMIWVLKPGREAGHGLSSDRLCRIARGLHSRGDRFDGVERSHAAPQPWPVP